METLPLSNTKDVEKFFSTSRRFENITIVPPAQWRPELYLAHKIFKDIIDNTATLNSLKWFAWANQCAGWTGELVSYFITNRINMRNRALVLPFFVQLMPESAFDNVFYPFFESMVGGDIASFTQQNWVMIYLEIFATRPQILIGPMLVPSRSPEDWKQLGVLYQRFPSVDSSSSLQ